jgi:hypothetical protein
MDGPTYLVALTREAAALRERIHTSIRNKRKALMGPDKKGSLNKGWSRTARKAFARLTGRHRFFDTEYVTYVSTIQSIKSNYDVAKTLDFVRGATSDSISYILNKTVETVTQTFSVSLSRIGNTSHTPATTQILSTSISSAAVLPESIREEFTVIDFSSLKKETFSNWLADEIKSVRDVFSVFKMKNVTDVNSLMSSTAVAVEAVDDANNNVEEEEEGTGLWSSLLRSSRAVFFNARTKASSHLTSTP